MNFLSTCLIFLVACIFSFFLSMTGSSSPEVNLFFNHAGYFFICAIVFTLIICFFYQMSGINRIKEHRNEITCLNNKITEVKRALDDYKTVMTDKILGYPNYEKEILQMILSSISAQTKQNNTDANNNLNASTNLLSSFPELKYSDIFLTHIQKLQSFISNISSYEREKITTEKYISDIKSDGWMFSVKE